MIRGMQSNVSYGESYPLVGATPKHFFAYNLESYGRDPQYRLGANIIVSETDLRQTYLPAFDAAIKRAHPRGVMCSYNAVNGIPACAHPMIQNELRERAGFKGFIVSDCGAIKWMCHSCNKQHRGHFYTNSSQSSSAEGLKAGTDLDCGGVYASANGILLALSTGILDAATVDTSLARLLTQRVELGNLDPAGTNPLQRINTSVIDSAEHRAVALRLAMESIVLLKNNDAALPGVVARAKTIAVLGPNADRTATLLSNYAGCREAPGGAITRECTLVTPLEGITARGSSSGATTVFAQGCEVDSKDTSQIAAAVAAARGADVAIFVGGLVTCQETGKYCQEAEALDRTRITLPGQQLATLQAIAATGTPTILVLMSGSTVSVPWAAANASVPAIVQLWYPGEEGGTALASILFGDANPSGRMPETVFTGLEQLPSDYLSVTMSDAPGRTHRYFTQTPLYAFGFGMSYSRRAYSGLEVSNNATLSSSDASASVTVSAMVTCIDGPAGVEVVQLYTSFRHTGNAGKQSIPLRELKGFTRVRLESSGGGGGDSGRSWRAAGVGVEFELTASDLALVDVDGTVRALVGTYDLWIGGTGPSPLGAFVNETAVTPVLHGTLVVIQ